MKWFKRRKPDTYTYEQHKTVEHISLVAEAAEAVYLYNWLKEREYVPSIQDYCKGIWRVYGYRYEYEYTVIFEGCTIKGGFFKEV